MKTMIIALIAALGVSFGAPAQASAQQQTTRQVTVGTLLAALNNISANIQDVQALDNLTIQDVQVADVDNVLNNNNVEAFGNALNRNETQITVLRDFLNNSANDNVVEVIKNSLNNNNVAITDLAAIDVLSGGDVVVFRQ